jgi:hypothetical protein
VDDEDYFGVLKICFGQNNYNCRMAQLEAPIDKILNNLNWMTQIKTHLILNGFFINHIALPHGKIPFAHLNRS